MLIARVVLAVAALLSDWGVQLWAERNLEGGIAIVGGRVVTEQMVNFVQILLLLAAVLFLASAVLKVARALITGLAFVALVGIAAAVYFVPDDQLQWLRDNGCSDNIIEVSSAAREACAR